MYQNKMAFAVKVGGKVLREDGETVRIPFNSEYSILIKNLNSVRAIVRISVDGQDIIGDGGLVVNPNSSVDLERFIKNNLNSGNKLKFIERTEAVSNHRGNKVDDGLIRIEYKFEKKIEVIETLFRYDSDPQWPIYTNGRRIGQAYGQNLNQFNGTLSATSAHVSEVSKGPLRSLNVSNDVGITVEGSQSDQKFTSISSFSTEDTIHVMVIRMIGEINQVKVEKPILVSHKPKCKTCGKLNKANAKFCTECGTSLQII